jgi:hypothetical protein
LFWETPAQALSNKNSTNIHEVLQPAKILDVESSQTIERIEALLVMKGAYLVLATSDRQQFTFMVKLGSSSKS